MNANVHLQDYYQEIEPSFTYVYCVRAIWSDIY